MTEQFAKPAPPSSGMNYDALKDSLLMVEVLAVEEHVPTIHTRPGEKSPAVRANVTVLDGDLDGTVYADTLVFPKILQSQLRQSVGAKVLGRIIQGKAKPGQNAPWMLAEASEQDIATAVHYQNTHQGARVQSAQAPF